MGRPGHWDLQWSVKPWLYDNKIYKHITALSKNVYISMLDEIVQKYDKSYYRTIKIESAYVKPSSYIDYGVKYNDNVSKFKVGDHVRISKYKNIFATWYTPIWYDEVWTYVISDLKMVKKLLEHSRRWKRLVKKNWELKKQSIAGLIYKT